jgi:DNA-binding CsgD family transcriptional regulator
MEILTKREDEVALQNAWGLSEKMIAAKLFISRLTVRKHKGNIMKKWNAANDKDMTRIYVLSNPQKFMLTLFIALQFGMIYTQDSSVRVFKTARAAKTAKRYEY